MANNEHDAPEALFPSGTHTKGPVECFGMVFKNDEERRKYFLQKLQAKLKDPEFRKIEGFPIGSDEDILVLSDPPYYTACPNPFIGDFIKQNGKPYDPRIPYSREPFAADVSEGKNDPIYNAHSYHTKVPHKAIMRYMLHYTEPGDVVFDGFCGTGMAGVAAQLCGNPGAIIDLGFTVNGDGKLVDSDGQVVGVPGARIPILNDLSPAATLISSGYNLTRSPSDFARIARTILDQFNKKFGWLYVTKDPKTGDECPISFTVWSEIFTCPECTGEIDFWALAYDDESGEVADKSKCPHCTAEVSKRDLIRKTASYFDKAVGTTRHHQVLRPVEIHYKHRGIDKTKQPDDDDFQVLKKAEKLLETLKYPTDLVMFVPEGQEWGDLYRGYHEGISRVHDFYLPRQLAAYSLLWSFMETLPTAELRRLWSFTLQGVAVSFTRRNRFLKNAYSQVNRALSGTLYIGSTVSEPSPSYVLEGKIKRFSNAIPAFDLRALVSSSSLAGVEIPPESIDYVFIDPPFGDNLPYAELNFLWEAWLRVFTNSKQDAVVNGKQHKDLGSYTQMMTACLKRVYHVLKPGRWVTVEFHNSKNAVWTAIQEALGRAGFIVGDVSVLDKGMKTKKQLHAKAVDKDLVISAYKPNGGLEKRFELEAGTEEGVWDFVRTHLRQLPVFIKKNNLGQVITERQQVLLFDRMVAFHVQRSVSVPMSAGDFYEGLARRFPVRDGMHFLPEQVAEYEKKRMGLQDDLQMELFVCDESSAIQWLRQEIMKKPQTAGELKPRFMQEINGWQKNEKLLELDDLLAQNFLRYDGKEDVPSQIHRYLSSNWSDFRNKPKDDALLRQKAKDRWYVPDPNKVGDLEKLRERSLLGEFDDYRTSSQKRLKVFRLEAVRAGFKKCWQERDYDTIIAVAQKVPDEVLQEDAKLLMWYDQALTRRGQ